MNICNDVWKCISLYLEPSTLACVSKTFQILYNEAWHKDRCKLLNLSHTSYGNNAVSYENLY